MCVCVLLWLFHLTQAIELLVFSMFEVFEPDLTE